MNKKTARRGMTLVEISVVLAIIAIVSAMVVSFCLMINTRAKTAEKKLAVMQDLTVTEATVESFVLTMAERGATFAVSEGGKTLVATLAESTFACTFDGAGETLSCTVDDEENVLSTTAFTDISFSVLENTQDYVILCTVSYTLPHTESEAAHYTFCINPFVGETREVSV